MSYNMNLLFRKPSSLYFLNKSTLYRKCNHNKNESIEKIVSQSLLYRKSFHTNTSQLFSDHNTQQLKSSEIKNKNNSKNVQNEPQSSTTTLFEFKSDLDIKHIKENKDKLKLNLERRNADTQVDLDKIIEIYDQIVKLEFHISKLRQERNLITEQTKDLMKQIQFKPNSVKTTKAIGINGVDNKDDVGKTCTEPKKEISSLISETEDLEERKKSLLLQREEMIFKGKCLKLVIQNEESKLEQLKSNLQKEAFHLPNETDPSVPIGQKESDSEIIATDGQPLTEQQTGFKLKDHVELCESLDLCDFVRAGKVSGSGFYYLKNEGALLEMALSRYAMDFCLRKGGFVPILTPDLIRQRYLAGCGFSPRSGDPQTFYVSSNNPQSDASSDSSSMLSSSAATSIPPDMNSKQTLSSSVNNLVLAATAEFPLMGMYSDEVILETQLPLKMVAMGHCFRAEGMAGALNRGLYRVHQFTKIEMVALTTPDQSNNMLEHFLELEMKLFSSLGICYRVLKMPTGDLGAPAYKKYDIEAWMPGRNRWGEISSTSNCTDYQSRRLNIRYIDNKKKGKSSFVHTVNGTAIAIPRLIIALLENNQLEDGSVVIPEALRPYFLGQNGTKIQVKNLYKKTENV